MSVELGPTRPDLTTDEPAYLRQLRRLLVLFDRAMGDEGVPATTRDRVVARVLHGTPTPDATPDRDWVEPEPRDLAVVEALAADEPGDGWPASFDDLSKGAVVVPMGDDSNSGPGWPVRHEHR